MEGCILPLLALSARLSHPQSSLSHSDSPPFARPPFPLSDLLPLPSQVKGKDTTKKFTKFAIDYAVPMEDGLLEGGSFERFLLERIKVDGKTGNLGDKVTVKQDGNTINVDAQTPFSKR